MFDKHASRQLAAYLDGGLDSRATADVKTHVASCERCRGELEQTREGMAMVEALPLAPAPHHLWTAIESALDRPAAVERPAVFPWRFAAAAAALGIVAVAALWYVDRPRGESWEVVRLAGSPSIGSERIAETALIRGGQSIETDGSSRARIQIGEIGSVDVEPNTQVAIVVARSSEHRLALRSGEIAAKILAPPRLFFVETPSGTAVDLGCEYTLRCDRSGEGILRVQAGWVAFEFEGRESLVPAGATCRTRPGIGPGTPYFDDAPEPLIKALDAFDFHGAGPGPGAGGSVGRGGGAKALSVVLAESRTRDTLTLWHLLSRVDAGDRVRVYERMEALSPPPEGISRQPVLALDAESLRRWREELAWTW
ncbi:MAG: zf-HC2 domain-containing protein [Bryobacterales bacterium]